MNGNNANGTKKVRAMAHIHTSNSWDCRMTPARLVNLLVKHDIGLAVISDHDSYQGSIDCRRIINEHRLPIRVPIAAEVRTHWGDVVVIFDPNGPPPPPIKDLLDFNELHQRVRDTGGLVWLPHPYEGHKHIDELATEADMIEVFNSRCTDQENRLAEMLCRNHAKMAVYGADAHRPSEVGNCIAAYNDRIDILETLRHPPEPVTLINTPRSSMMASRATNGFKNRRPLVVGYQSMRWAQNRAKETERPGS